MFTAHNDVAWLPNPCFIYPFLSFRLAGVFKNLSVNTYKMHSEAPLSLQIPIVNHT
jgi:hypothetical protein